MSAASNPIPAFSEAAASRLAVGELVWSKVIYASRLSTDSVSQYSSKTRWFPIVGRVHAHEAATGKQVCGHLKMEADVNSWGFGFQGPRPGTSDWKVLEAQQVRSRHRDQKDGGGSGSF